MRLKYIIIFMICCVLFVLFPPFPNQNPLTAVFRVTEEPAVIVRGTSGSALTVNISFGDVEVEQWIQELSKPYPLLFVDMEWAERFPETVRLISEKNIPVGLLGHEGKDYEQNIPLFIDQVQRFEILFGKKPLWFRTMDEDFPAVSAYGTLGSRSQCARFFGCLERWKSSACPGRGNPICSPPS